MSEAGENEVARSWGAEEERKLLAHVNAKWKDAKCAMCGANGWSVHGFVNLTLDPRPRPVVDVYGGLGLLLGGGAHLPLASMTCVSCGATVLINLAIAGVVARVAPASESDSTPPRTS